MRRRLEHGRDFVKSVHAKGGSRRDEIDDDIGDPEVRGYFRCAGNRNDLDAAGSPPKEILGDARKAGRNTRPFGDRVERINAAVIGRGDGKPTPSEAEVGERVEIAT